MTEQLKSNKEDLLGANLRLEEERALIAAAAREKQIESVVFNRNGFLYHGRVKALAEAAREAGLSF